MVECSPETEPRRIVQLFQGRDTERDTLEISPASGCLNAISISFGVSWSCDRLAEIVPATSGAEQRVNARCVIFRNLPSCRE
jgi:hypothetical protein